MSTEDLWFEGYVGIGQRITVTKMPKSFGVNEWEALDLMLDNEPKPQLDIEEQGFYKFTLSVESGFEDEYEWGFEIDDYFRITNP